MKIAEPASRLRTRLGWFVLLYIAGVLAVVSVAVIFRLLVLSAVR
jgi:cytochrome c1